jgi:hypothetical protein
LSVSGGIGSNAAFIVDQLNSGNILSASASGVTRFTLANDGDLTLTGGDVITATSLATITSSTALSLNPTSGNDYTLGTSATGTLNLFNTNATTVNAFGAGTSINLGPGGATATTVNIAGGSGATGCTIDGATGNLTCSGTGSFNELSVGGITDPYVNESGDTMTGTLTFSNVATDITTAATEALTLTPGTTGQLVLNSANTGTDAIDINVTGSGGDLDIDVNDAITIDSASFSIDGTSASNVSVTGNNLTISTITSGDLALTSAGNLTETFGGNSTFSLSDGTTTFLGIDGNDVLSLRSARAAGNTTTEALSIKTTTDLGVADELLQIGDSAADFLTMLGNGNIGIGTVAPAHKLHIEATTNQKAITAINGDGNQDLFTASVSGTTKFLVDKTGNVGIGVTNPSSFQLEVAGNIGPAANDTYNLGSDTRIWNDIYTDRICFDGNVDCLTTGAGAVNYWQRIAGNLSPVNLNDTIAATTSAATALTVTQTGDFDALLVQDESGDTSPFAIKSDGNVGIGTSTPLAKLDVQGTASLSGNLIFSGLRTIASEAFTQLTLGNSTTGDILFSPGTW